MAAPNRWTSGRRVVALLCALAAGVSLWQFARVFDPPQPAVGDDVASFAVFAAQNIPSDALYLYVQPGQFGYDTGSEPRLRYELYPRQYQDVRVAQGENAARSLVQQQHLSYILIPHAHLYPADSWVRQNLPWFQRLQQTPDSFLLVVKPTA